MKFKRLLFVAFCLLSMSGLVKARESQQIEIIPAVESVVYNGTGYKLDNSVSISYSGELENEATLLKEYLLKERGIEGKLKQNAKKGDITLSIKSLVASAGNEAYQLRVGKEGIRIEAPTAAGVFYGIQTLRQLIDEDNRTVRAVVINDSPAFPMRSFMLDEGRHFKGKAVVKQLMDEMARLKLNTFHWHLTDDQGWRIEIKKYPKLTEIGAFRDSTQIGGFNSTKYDPTPHGGFYTQDDIREIVAYAAARHINIIPEIEIPGHASAAVAAYPWLGTTGQQIKVSCRFGVHYEAYNIANPRTFEFLEDVIDEIIQLFPGDIIHIGGDEVRYNHWKESKEINEFMKEKGIQTYPELQVWMTNLMSEKIKAKGRRMMGWNEITGDQLHEYQQEKVEDQKQHLAEGTVVQVWKGNPDLIKKNAAKGYNILNSYHSYTYLDYDYSTIPLEKAYSFNPIPDDLPKELRSKIIGIGCQMWGEFIPTVKDMNLKVYPRIAAYAEVGWTRPEQKDFERFKHSLKKLKAIWKNEGIEYYEMPGSEK